MIKSRNHLVVILIIVLTLTSIVSAYFLIRTSNELKNTRKSLSEAQALIVSLQENVTSSQKMLGSFNINSVNGEISTFSNEQDIVKWFNSCISNNSDSIQNARKWYPLFEYMLIQGYAIHDGHIISTSMWNGEPVSMAFTPEHTYFLFYSPEEGTRVYRVDGTMGWGILGKEHWVLIKPLS